MKRGAPAVHEERTLDDLWQRRMPIIAEDAGYDPNRDKNSLSKQSNVKNGVNPLAYLVGPVTVKYGGDPARSTAIDLTKYIDSDNKMVRSNTGEIEMDYGRGLCTLNAPKAQGATGFLKKAGAVKLADVTIASGNDYATVLVVSMDGKPLKASGGVTCFSGHTYGILRGVWSQLFSEADLPENHGCPNLFLPNHWSRDGKKVSIDSVHEGARQVYLLDVEKIVAG